MKSFSTPTALLMVSLAYLLMPSITWMVLGMRRSAAVTLWCVGGIGMSIAFMLIGLRGIVPTWATFSLANLLVFNYILFRSQSLRLDQSRPWRTGRMVLASLAFIVVFEGLRLGMGNLFWVVQYDHIVYLLGLTYLATLAYDTGKQEQSRSGYWIAFAYLLAASVMLVQVITNATGLTAPGDLNAITGSVFAFVWLFNAVVTHVAYIGLVLERSRRETAIAADRYQKMLNTTSDGFWLVDGFSGRLLDVNAVAASMSGYSRQELQSMRISDLDLHHSPEDVARHSEAIARQGWELFETQHQTRDGRIVDVEVSTSFDSETQTFVAFLRDISERKRQEQALRQARDDADAANVAKSQFLAHMSHEIRTPMNGVLGMAQLLEMESLSPDQREMVQHIRAAGKSLLSIINDILDFSKIEAGQLVIERHPFNLERMLSQVANITRVTAETKSISLRVESAPALAGEWIGDGLRLEQVLFNLVGNAVKFTERGGVVIRVQPLNSDAEKFARLRFEVIDSGIGMEPDAAARLFTPFTQADATIARRFGSTGLGLSISKRLIELMGGAIGVSSKPGQGSTFWFELPLEAVPRSKPTDVDSRPAADAFGNERSALRLSGLRVLIVDDGATNRMFADRVLKLRGAITTQATDGQQALDLLKAQPQDFDLVLMDIQMPVIDGLTATRAIREELKLETLPVIALTAGVMAEEKQKALDAGVTDFLAKPIDINLLTEVIKLRCSDIRPPSPSPSTD